MRRYLNENTTLRLNGNARKERDPDKTRRWVEESNITTPPEGKNRRQIIEIKEWGRKCQVVPQLSLKRHPQENGRTELLENQQRNKKFVVGLWKTSQNSGEILPLTKTIDWIDLNKETRNYFTGRINEELGSFISTIIATILREGFR